MFHPPARALAELKQNMNRKTDRFKITSNSPHQYNFRQFAVDQICMSFHLPTASPRHFETLVTDQQNHAASSLPIRSGCAASPERKNFGA
jgi:hypothetical protein